MLYTIVRDVMIKDTATISDEATVGEAIEMFASKRVGSICVVDSEGDLVGILTDGDVIDYVIHNVNKTNKQLNHIRSWEQIDCFGQYLKNVVDHPINKVYTKRVISTESHATVREASRLINKKRLKHLPVVDKGKLVGIITRNALVRGLFDDYLANPDAPCVEGAQDDDF